MKAIRTYFRSFVSETKPAFYVAQDGDGNRVTVTVNEIEAELVDGNWTPEGYHRFAAQKLCDKMGWIGEFITGGYDTEFYHVFLPKSYQVLVDELLDALQAFMDNPPPQRTANKATFEQFALRVSKAMLTAQSAIAKAKGVQSV